MNRKNIRIHNLAVLLAVLAVFWIGMPGQMVAADKQPPAANRMKPDHAPTPFSADEIRNGSPRGRKIVYQVEMLGKPYFFQTIEFTSANPDDVVFETVTKGMDGKRVGKKQMSVGKWPDLQSHASFPASQTVITSESLTTPAGTFDCWLYTITNEKDGKTNIKRFWFAKKLPGPPISYEEKTDGKIVYKLTMLKTGMEKK
jgi:hypothetical protein